MDTEPSQRALEPTVPRAVWQHRWLVLVAVVLSGCLGAAYSIIQPEEWVATASLVVEDPRASALFELGVAQRPERYVENQVEILSSPAVAAKASEILLDGDPSYSIDADAIDNASSARGRSDRDLITIAFHSNDPDLALRGADALAIAYQKVRRSEAARSYSAALGQLDDSIAVGQQELAQIQDRINGLRAGASRDELDAQFESALTQLVELQRQILDHDTTENLSEDLAVLQQQFATLQVVVGIESQRPELSALLDEQTEAIRRISVLITRRDQLTVDSEIAASGVVLFSPAQTVESAGIDVLLAGLIGVLLGALVGAAAAFALALGRRQFMARTEPALVLGVPLISEIPDFGDETLSGGLPVIEAPASVSAEAFRFVAAALRTSPAEEVAESDPTNTRSIVMISADPGDGKSVVVANVALAAAREGRRVLVVDADFGNQKLVGLLAPEAMTGRGLTDVVLDDADIESATTTVTYEDGSTLHVLGRGGIPVTAPDFFADPSVWRRFHELRVGFDLVLIDTPPMLHVAYASAIPRFGDFAVVVVRHGSDIAALEDLRDRTDLLGVSVSGYIYNRSPLRREMSVGSGSTLDVLGSAGTRPVVLVTLEAAAPHQLI